MRRLITLTTLAISTLIISCSQDNLDEIESSITEEYNIESITNIAEAPYEEQVAYTQKHLQNVAKYVLMAAENPDFYESLLSSIENRDNRFDNNILAEDMLKNQFLQNMNLNDSQNESLSNSLNAFKNIDNIDYAPHIYIPNFIEKIRAQRKNAEKSNDRILAVISVTEEEGTETLMGYYEEEGELIESGILVDEEYANLNPVIVIGTTGSDCDGNYYSPRCQDEQSNDTSGDNEIESDRLFIETMEVKQHKEDWHNGRSEIHYVRIKVIKSTGETLTSQGPDTGNRLRDFRRTWINNGDRKDINKTVNDNLLPTIDHIMVIFEKDGWLAPLQSANVLGANGQIYTLFYRSFQDEYDGRSFDQGTENLNRENTTNSIEYNTKVL